MITYRVDVYRSRPIGASLLCLALKGLHTGLGGRGDYEWRHVATGCTVLIFITRTVGRARSECVTILSKYLKFTLCSMCQLDLY